ncbi:MAG: hypothetical protein MJ032_00375 [Acidaminococcaceae bacterium]|nr:hypothetical protein [Acidaminococcaceae bacterium]
MENTADKKEIYREETVAAGDRKLWAVGALLLIFCLYGLEYYNYTKFGQISLMGFGMDTVILGLWIWRVMWKYELILYPGRLVVISRGLGITGHYEVDLSRTESYTDKYVRSFFRKTKIKEYYHRYSSLDANPQRLLCYTKGKKNKLTGVIFKASDEFMKQLRKELPGKFLQLTEGVPK